VDLPETPAIPADCPSLNFGDCGYVPALLVAAALVDPNRPFERQDFSDTKFVNTPDWNVNLALTYFFDLEPVGTFSIRGDYSWQDAVFFSPQNTTGTDSYGLLGFRVALENDRWIDTTLAFWMKNVLDEVYVENGIDLGAGIGADQYFYGRPRSYGGEVIIRF
jgi:outer membrane receptor protein involved in Fe transport